MELRLWPQKAVSWKRRPRVPETRFECDRTRLEVPAFSGVETNELHRAPIGNAQILEPTSNFRSEIRRAQKLPRDLPMVDQG